MSRDWFSVIFYLEFGISDSPRRAAERLSLGLVTRHEAGAALSLSRARRRRRRLKIRQFEIEVFQAAGASSGSMESAVSGRNARMKSAAFEADMVGGRDAL
jgi:hypothetical protein